MHCTYLHEEKRERESEVRQNHGRTAFNYEVFLYTLFRAVPKCSVTTQLCGNTCILMGRVFMFVPNVGKLSLKVPS
jgi:hypothetical protein